MRTAEQLEDPEEPRALCWGGQLETAEGLALWVHCRQEGIGSSKLATSQYQQHPQPLNPASTHRPNSSDSSTGTPLLQRAQKPCARCCTVTKPVLPSHTAETRAGTGARPPAPMGHAPLGDSRLAAAALG